MDIKKFTSVFEKIYGGDSRVLTKQSERYQRLDAEYLRYFDEQERFFFSTPGRTELSGNHTDHNHGRILAASVNLDSIAVVTKNNSQKIVLRSEGFSRPFEVNLNRLEVDEKEKGTTSALIRGIAARFEELGYKTGGFSGCMTSDVMPGSGLSSSASVEVLIGSIFNYLYNDDQIPSETIAQIGQYAENKYFGKPCGLMDQMACAVGGIMTIDFKNPHYPLVDKVEFDFDKENYGLIIVDTGGNHVDLTDDYSAIPAEMKATANLCGGEVMRDIDPKEFIRMIPQIRKTLGDRAVLRGLHFIAENDRVVNQVNALENGAFNTFLNLVKESGNSSFKWLQNIYTTKNIKEQGVTLALALTEDFLTQIGTGACRVHGGGFAGTIQVFLPNRHIKEYIDAIVKVFGSDSAMILKIRPVGTLYLNRMI